MPTDLLAGYELVGKGFTSDVYAWGEGRVLKLFHSWVSSQRVERYFRTNRVVQLAGLPVPATYEMVQIDGRHGIVFERVQGISMLRHVQSQPWKLFAAVRQLAELHAQVHACVAPRELPSQRERIRNAIDAVTESEDQKAKARQCLELLPDGESLCHGDFHPENVLFTARGPIIIDWDSASRGHPSGDVACTSRLIQKAGLPPWSPRYMHLLLQLTRPLLHSAYLRRYRQLRSAGPEEVSQWQLPLAVAAPAWRMTGLLS